MKKLSVLTFALSLLCIASCNNNPVKGNGENTSDSTLNDSSTTLAPGEVPDEMMEGNSNFMSPDTKLNDLHGLVNKCSYRRAECDENGKPNIDYYWYTEVKVFDRDGFLDLKAKELDWRLNDPKVERNDQQQITKVKWYVSDFGCDIFEAYAYDSHGMLASTHSGGIENDEHITYKYKGDTLVSSESKGAAEGSAYRTTTTYTILETDDNGNWTRRISKQLYESGPDDGSGKYDESITSYNIEERTITYYE